MRVMATRILFQGGTTVDVGETPTEVETALKRSPHGAELRRADAPENVYVVSGSVLYYMPAVWDQTASAATRTA